MAYPNFIELYKTNRKQFDMYLKMFHKENPHLDAFTCEMILRTPPERVEEIMTMYERGELVDDTKGGESFVIESATIHHPDDIEPPREIKVELIEELK